MRALALLVNLSALSCSFAHDPKAPSDDPADWPVEKASYTLQVSAPHWLIPSNELPATTMPLPSNNNVEILFHEDRLFLAWRTAPTHFASADARMYLLSKREGFSWEHEATVAMGSDVREPRFLSIAGELFFYYFEGGTNPVGFEPKRMWRIRRLGPARWSSPEAWGEPGEVPWDLKLRGGRAYLTSYRGNHYQTGPSDIAVFFKTSLDGVSFVPVDPARPVVYQGGVSEVAFEFAEDGSLWAVTRNEDGDETGFGAHVCFATREALARWQCSPKSFPERYDSPELFRHGEEIYLVARRDLGGPFDEGRTDLSIEQARFQYGFDYWRRPKRTALYRLDRTRRTLVHLQDLPSAGDTAFPSVRRTGAHTFLLANYTSPLSDPDRSWVAGQTSPEGTQIYLLQITFARP